MAATLWLLHTDGTVESISATQGSDAYHVVLAGAPRLPLATDDALTAKTKFIFANATDRRAISFLVTEKEEKGPFTRTVRGIEYRDDLYDHDAQNPTEDA